MTRCRLQVRFRVMTWARFLFFFLLFFVPGFLGLGKAGQAPLRTAWIFFMAAFFGLGLPAILCRHCPHYARRGWFIVCPTTVGPPKILRPNPGPISRPEKAAFGMGFALVLGFPIIILAARGRFAFAVFALAGAGLFFLGERTFNCSRCLNFSCLFNRVPQETRAEWQANLMDDGTAR